MALSSHIERDSHSAVFSLKLYAHSSFIYSAKISLHPIRPASAQMSGGLTPCSSPSTSNPGTPLPMEMDISQSVDAFTYPMNCPVVHLVSPPPALISQQPLLQRPSPIQMLASPTRPQLKVAPIRSPIASGSSQNSTFNASAAVLPQIVTSNLNSPIPSAVSAPLPLPLTPRPTCLNFPQSPVCSTDRSIVPALATAPSKAPIRRVPSKTNLVLKPSTIREKSVIMERFRRSRTRRFFHPYATLMLTQKKMEIGAIQALKEVASSPDETAAKFASEALTVIGEEVPYKLAQQVPSWTVNDVQYWVRKIGFESYVDNFAKQMVDGDLLLHLTEQDLESDIGMSSGLHRKRFIRELESLKIAADYSSVDESNLDQFLMSLSPELSVYTYQMLSTGVNRSLLASLTDDLMQTACGITNPIHRLKLKQAFQDSKHPDDVEVAMLSKQIDVFISYRRSTGNQLASLIKVLLQLSGYKVFIDVDKLYAGKFDSSLLKNIQAAKHFILVLTPHSLDRLLNDHNCEDWIHKELKCAFDHNKNIIPIFDQAFEFPAQEDQIPQDIRNITKYNGVRWVHDYQDACMQKVIRFIQGELNKTSMPTTVPTTKMANGHHHAASTRKQISSSSAKWSTGTATPRLNSSAKPSKQTEPPTPTFSSIIADNKAKRKAYHSSVSTVYGP